MSYGPRPWQQTNWDWRAATNFILGGAGSGLIVAAALASSASRIALLAGLVLVAAGLGTVWLEIGRKMRAAHVFFNPFTSWMTRESFAAALLFTLGVCSLAFDAWWLTYAVALAAALFAWCQGRILRAAKGIPAWRMPQVVQLILTTALAEGSGLLLFMNSDLLAISLFAIAVLARAFSWSGYWRALNQPSSRSALEAPGRALMQVGAIAPLALALGALFLPQIAPLAGLAALLTGWWLKFVLVTRAALNQGFGLPQLPVRGVR